MKREYLFTSESVTEGHPDKIADRISDEVLDAYLEVDEYSRVACETMVTTNQVYITGEITSKGIVDIEKIVRRTLKDIGYTKKEYGIDADTCNIEINVDEQSVDIAAGVDDSLETREGEETTTGAGDQGLMFGYATKETDAYMPYPIYYAQRLAQKLTEYRRERGDDIIRPDGKTQVTVKYKGNEIDYVDTIVVSTQHSDLVSNEELEELIQKNVIRQVVPHYLLTDKTKVYINPSGRFVVGGPQGDVGLTGRKIIVDTYGGWSRHGGGAFSGKDSTKVDRSASYMARYIAKNLVATDLVGECEVQLAYAIGKAEPVSVYINTFGTSKIASDRKLEELVKNVFKLDPDSIIEELDLRKPIYKETSAYGHFGRNGFTWEQTDKTKQILIELLDKKYLIK